MATQYVAPAATKPTNNLFISDDEKNKWRNAWVQLDGNDESIPYQSNITISNNILNSNSTLYDSSNSISSSSITTVGKNVVDYSKQGNWASIDELGKSITDTLGGIHSNLGYTILDEQLGTFKAPSAYDNTQSYKTALNPNTVAGAQVHGAGGSYQKLGTSPIFMQKDFAGVANIFAPNIYVSNAPLRDDGMPDISFSNGDGNVYSV